MICRLVAGIAALSLAGLLAAVPAALAHPLTDRHAPVDTSATVAEGVRVETSTSEQPLATPPRAVATPVTAPGALAGLALLSVLLLAARRPRRAVIALAVFVLVVLAFESGLHSVHHLGDERGASQCSVASAAPHLIGSPCEPPAFSPQSPAIGERLIAVDRPAPSSHAFRRDVSRGPPRPGPSI